MSGTNFCKNTIGNLKDDAREKEIFDAITGGQAPPFMSKLVNIELKKGVHFTTIKKDGHDVVAIVCQVTPDYLSVGTNDDYVRMPMRPATAQKIADKFKCLLPTRKLVDALESQPFCKKAAHVNLPQSNVPAALKEKYRAKAKPEDRNNPALNPDFLAYQEYMHTTDAYLVHNNQINEGELKGVAVGKLVSGHKKDIVLPAQTGKVVIYDWPKSGKRSVHGTHGSFYADYSHGVRLVRDNIVLDFGGWGDNTMSFADALKHPEIHKAFADAPILKPRYDTDK
jgi:hypothetical protein